MKRLINISILFVALIGCESSDIVSLPSTESKLIVNSIGYSGYPWRARVSASQDVLDTARFKYIDNAKVNIYENGALAESLVLADFNHFDPDGALYTGSTSTPKPGNVYRVTVESPGYPMIESEFLQPDAVQPQTLSTKVLGPGTYGLDLSVKVGFTDPPGENYYEIIGMASNSEGNAIAYLGFQFVDPAFRENNGVFYQTLAFDDSFFDGQTVEFEFLSSMPEFTDYRFITVYLRNLSKDYYLYLKTTNLQRNAANDPFAQPVMISNNIVNGYGVFGGYTEAFKTIEYSK